jgi:hypothetical protein
MLRKLARKWWFWLGLTGFLLVALVVGGVYAEWAITRNRGEARRDAIARHLDAEDPTWRLHDLNNVRNGTIPPADRNAGEQAIRAVGLTPKSVQDWTVEEKWRAELKPGVLPHEEDVCEASVVWADATEALVVARSVRHLPTGGFRLTPTEPNPLGTLLPNTQKVREAASLLDLDAILLAYTGRPDEAIESAHAILNCGRGLGDEPTLISQLVRMAAIAIAKNAIERTLGWGEPSQGLAELQAALAEEFTVPRLTYGFRGERGLMFRLLENLDDGELTLEELSDGKRGGLTSRLMLYYYRKHIPAQQAKITEIFNELLAADKLGGAERRAAFDRITIPPPTYENILARLLMPAWDKVASAEDRTRTNLGTAVAALACERYRRKFGRWPESLPAIPRDILPDIPTDPYTGRPLAYGVTDDGVVVYATGPDESDDGGLVLDPRGTPGTDIGFRLFNPGDRRQAPPPKVPEPDWLDPVMPPGIPQPENEP